MIAASAFRTISRLIGAAATISVAAASGAQIEKIMVPMSLAKAEELAKACVGATVDLEATEKRLVEAGWPKSKASAELDLFSRDGAILILARTPNSARSTCAIMMKLAKPVPGDELYPAMDRVFGVKASKAENGQPLWIYGSEIAGVTADSASAATGIRIVVAPNGGEGKK